MRSKLLTLLAILALAALVACGTPGAPQPPSLELPRTVGDLKAVRKGDKVTLAWTTPRETTDRARIKHLGATRICRAVDRVAVAECAENVGTLPPEQTPLAAAASFPDTLPQQLQETHSSGFASYAVEVENSRGRSAGLSNQVVVPLAPTLPPPSDLKAQVTAHGVELTWTEVAEPLPVENIHHVYRIYRRLGTTGPVTPIATQRLSEPKFLDDTAGWERTYSYWLTVETVRKIRDVSTGTQTPTPYGTQVTIADGAEIVPIEGVDSAPIEVFVHDVFPPAVPAGLQAVSSGTPQQPFIDLSWAPNTESDLAGYNVYRHEEGAASVKINSEVVKAPTYRDSTVQAGRRYSYSVTAVDVRGNESEKSAEASETVPQQ